MGRNTFKWYNFFFFETMDTVGKKKFSISILSKGANKIVNYHVMLNSVVKVIDI